MNEEIQCDEQKKPTQKTRALQNYENSPKLTAAISRAQLYNISLASSFDVQCSTRSCLKRAWIIYLFIQILNE